MKMTTTYDTPLLTALERLGPHDHQSLIYESQEERFAVAIPFIRIGLDARRGSDFPLLIAFLDTGDRLIRINQADLVDVVLVNLKCFLFCFFLLLPCFFPAKFGEVNVGAKNDKKREENRCAFESHVLRFIQTEMPATRTPAGSNSSMTYETSRPCDSVMVRRRSSGLFGRMEMKFSS